LATEQSTYVVVGAGLAGAATAWRLAEAGHDVTLVERGQPADRGGSSHGSARIFRYAYPSRFYTDLVVRSRPLWSELEAAAGEQLLTRSGCLDWGEQRDPQALARSLEEAGVEHELLSAAAASKRWDFEFDSSVLWQPDAGVIDAERSVTAMADLAGSHGARLVTGRDVRSIERTDGGYRLRDADGGSLDAERVVLCAGGFLPRLLQGAGLDSRFVAAMPSLTVTQEQAFHFPYRDSGSAWPTFINKADDIQTYGLPGGRDAGFRGQKLAEYAAGKRLPSAYDQDRQIDPANRERLISYVEKNLPGLVPEPYAETTCLFTSTPTEDFVLDRTENLTVISPCSGHGAKFAPLIGVLGAHLAGASTTSAGRAAMPREFLLGNAFGGPRSTDGGSR
jgi:sarcosine oxidase